MKRALILATLISLAACSAPSDRAELSTVASCDSIKNAESASNSELLCLDGGKGVDPQSLRGPVIVNVWGSWCSPCKREIPLFVSYIKQKSALPIVGIDVEEKNIEAGRTYAQRHQMSWPNLYDSKGSTRSYFGMGVPVTWFIDEDGKILYKKIGPLKSVSELNRLVEKYLGAA